MARFTKPYSKYEGKFYDIVLGDNCYIVKYIGIDGDNYLIFTCIFISYDQGPYLVKDQRFARQFDGNQIKMPDDAKKIMFRLARKLMRSIFIDSFYTQIV
jgi:hypothetical protein